MDDSPRPHTPGNLEASMLNVIDEVDSCLERILVRRSSLTNRSRTSGNMDSLSPVNETIAEQAHDGIQSDNSSDATIELDDDYAAGQLSTSGVATGSPDEVVSIDDLGTQSVILPEDVPQPRQLRSQDYTARQPSTSSVATEGLVEVVSVEELGTQSVILPENVPLPRQLRSEEVIDLSDSLTTYSPRATQRNPQRSPAADVIELSSDEEGPSSTSRSTAAAQPLMHITYSTCPSHPSVQSTNIVIDLGTNTFSYGNGRSPRTSNSGTIYTLDSPRNISQAMARSRRNAQYQRIYNPRTMDTPNVSESTNQPYVPEPCSASSGDTNVACPICYESLFQRKLLSTICGHVFCEPCLRTALKMSKKCPICNRSITRPNQMHPLYLPLNQP